MDPMTSYGLISGGSNLLGGLFSKEPDAQKAGQAYQTNPYGTAMAMRQLRNTMAGAGDFGFGNIAKQGMGTLGQMFAGRGIDPRSGVAMNATGNMFGNAMAQDAQARRNYAMSLMTYSPGTVTAANRAGPGWASSDFSNLGNMFGETQSGWGPPAEKATNSWEYNPTGSDFANWARHRQAAGR